MGKNDFLTPKAIGNRIKAKGLQKLRWYCQMCQKQCRDENGFKCHLNSESHRRQMQIFGEAPDRVIQGYSEEFHSTFVEHLRMAHPRVRIEAHKVYNEYIQDKHHVHMNSTKWLTLTEYVKYLGKAGICKVEETPKGWFIQLIHRDTDQELLDADRSKRRKVELEEAERQQREIDAQIERARAAEARDGVDGGGAVEPNAEGAGGGPRASLQERGTAEAPLQLSLGVAPSVKGRRGTGEAEQSRARQAGLFQRDQVGTSGRSAALVSDSAKRKASQVESIMEAGMARKAAAAAGYRADRAHANSPHSGPWLLDGIIVKVLARQLPDYYGQKARVVSTVDGGYVGELEVLGSGDVLRVDQAELQTVIPKVGNRVRVVLGPHAGELATVAAVLKERFKIELQLASGKVVLEEYEHVSKVTA